MTLLPLLRLHTAAWAALVLFVLTAMLASGPVLALSEDDGYDLNVVGNAVHTLTSTTHGTLIGGALSSIKGIPRQGAALVGADGSPASQYPLPSLGDGAVFASMQIGNGEIVIAGNFSYSSGVVAVDPLWPDRPWFNPNVNGAVRALAATHADPITGNRGIYIGGSFSQVGGAARSGVARLLWNGHLDTEFVPPVFSGSVHALAVQDDGKLLVAGSIGISGDLISRRLYRLNEDGTHDTSFVAAGMHLGLLTIHALAIEADGRILVAGENSGNGFIVRLNADGSQDASYTPPTPINGGVYALSLQPDGRVVIGGEFTGGVGLRSRVARLNEDGTVDSSFGTFINPDAAVRSVLVQDDGAVLIGGEFSSITGITRSRVARLDAQGRLDQPLVVVHDGSPQYSAIAMQADGRILLGGRFTQVNGVNRLNLARLWPNGQVDSSFAPVITPSGEIRAIAVQRDGRILVGGHFSSVNGVPRYNLARLHPDGSLDTSFSTVVNVGGLFYPAIHAILLQDDGRVVVGGSFTSINGQTRMAVARLLPDGALDLSFDPIWPDDRFPGIAALAFDDNGRIVTCGYINYTGTGADPLVYRLTSTGVVSATFLPAFSQVGSGYDSGRSCRAIAPNSSVVGSGYMAVAGAFRFSFGGQQHLWSMLGSSGNHTAASPLAWDNTSALSGIHSLQTIHSGYLAIGRFNLASDGTTYHVAGLSGAGQVSGTRWSSGTPEHVFVGAHLSPDGRLLLYRATYQDGDLRRLSNPLLPLQQRIFWGTDTELNPRLFWERTTTMAPALLGRPRVLVSQTCCDPASFQPGGPGSGLMTRSSNSRWHPDGFDGLHGKYYVRIEYRTGDSTGSSTFLTPIQRFHGEVPPHVPTANLALEMSPDLDGIQVTPGDTLQVIFQATNNGPDAATMTGADIELPDGYTLLAYTAGADTSFVPEEGHWKINNLAAGAARALTVQLQVDPGSDHTRYTIQGEVSAQTLDPDHSDNVVSGTPVVLHSRSDLAVDIDVAPADALPGMEVDFSIVVGNDGPEPASNVVVHHILPDGYGYLDHGSDLGSYHPATGRWQIATLAVGQETELKVTAQVNNEGSFVSTVQASSHSIDPEPDNNLAFVQIDPFTDLALQIDSDPHAADFGDYFQITVRVDNNGPRESGAATAQLQTLAGDFMVLDHDATMGSYEPATRIWDLGTVSAGEVAQLTIQAQFVGQQDLVVDATVDGAVFDLDQDNNSDSVTVRYVPSGENGIFFDRFERASSR